MTINDSRVQLATAFPPLEKEATQKGTSFRAPIDDRSGTRRIAYLKLLKIEDISREALCAVVARLSGLPIAQPFYVYVDPIYVPGHRTGNTDNLAFGLERDYYPTFRIANDQINEKIQIWPDALSCGVFDEWVFNGDRLPKNLLFASNGVYWMIDHDETLPNNARIDDICHSQILQILREGKNELELHRLRRDALSVVERFKKIDWSRVPDLLLPPELATTNIGIHVEKHIRFLKQRIEYMPDILTSCLNIKQLGLNLGDYKSSVEREEKK